MKLLGLPIAEKIKEELMRLPKPSVKLAIVQVGDDPVSSLYVKKKQEFAKEISVNTIVVKTTSGQIDQKIDELNRDHSVKAIIIQLPLPEGLSRNKLLAKISMHKDVDGFRYILGEQFITYPPTVLAIDDIFEFYKIPLEKGVLIVGGGFLVGKPLNIFLSEKSVQSEILTKDDPDYAKKLKSYDVVVVATGGGRIFESSDFKDGAYVIDASTVADEQKVRGDVLRDNEEIIHLAGVPGGVGPITVAELFRNFFLL